jgi:hypothetical protein
MMNRSVLFVLAASPPRPDDRRWAEQRPLGQEFVLNPPGAGRGFSMVICSLFAPLTLRQKS